MSSRRSLPILALAVALGLEACDHSAVQPAPGPMEVQVLPSTLPADGTSRATAVASLPVSAPAGTVVQFTTSKGTFQESDPSQPKVANIRARDRKAEATIVAGVQFWTAVVEASYLAGRVVTRSVELTPAGPQSILLSSPVHSAAADGKTSVPVEAFLWRDAGRVSAGLTVQLEVTDSATARAVASFSQIAETDSLGIARFKLISNDPVTLRLIAESGGELSNDVVVRFRE